MHTKTLRSAVRDQSTAWLAQAVSPQGRAGAIGWYPEDSSVPTVTGARCIAVVRAELKRRALAEALEA